PFDFIWSTRGTLYSTDNGANSSFGPAPQGGVTATSEDQLHLVYGGHYFGHANLNRAVDDSRQATWKDEDTAAHNSGKYSAPLALFESSTNGLEEYRATTFGGALRGELLVQKWKGELFRVKLTPDGRTIENVVPVPNGPTALDIVAGPGGAIVAGELFDCNLANNSCKAKQQIAVVKPNDAGAPSTGAYDIFPWRAPAAGGTPFVIGGVGFGGATSVSIGGLPATVSSVTATRIKGTIPANANPTAALLDVTVTSNGTVSTLTKAFRYLLGKGQGKGVWETGPAMPEELGEVAGGFINGVLYLIGDGDTTAASEAVWSLDLVDGLWRQLAARPFPGDHHAAEIIGDKLYLFGGIGGGSSKKVQIYDPSTNTWSTGADLPAAQFPNGSGSASTSLINGMVYFAGGIDPVTNTTTPNGAKYNPVANTWTGIAAMPLNPAQSGAGRNHAAAATDGAKFYVFGGRGPGSGDSNVPAPGFADVFVYNPSTNTWATSFDGSSGIPPLPQNRGGMGKAAFFNGEFYVIGGETTGNPPGTSMNVYKRVDVYNPTTKTWRLEADMPTGRHGIFPLVHDTRIYVAGGGVRNGHSHSSILEIFRR
ncbi:MAG: IPT/TIG domain-containing protein, partial [Bdellovibrionales bacterium]|nr:IPT/TIG domain-containing protein [Bdellovibrionales bacterium]